MTVQKFTKLSFLFQKMTKQVETRREVHLVAAFKRVHKQSIMKTLRYPSLYLQDSRYVLTLNAHVSLVYIGSHWNLL